MHHNELLYVPLSLSCSCSCSSGLRSSILSVVLNHSNFQHRFQSFIHYCASELVEATAMPVEVVILSVFASVTAIVIAGKLERNHHNKKLCVHQIVSRLETSHRLNSTPCLLFQDFSLLTPVFICFSRLLQPTVSRDQRADHYLDIHLSEDGDATSGGEDSASKKRTILAETPST